MKKFLPIILLFLGILVLLGLWFFVIRDKEHVQEQEDETALIEVTLSDRPVASLTPRSDGRWLDLKIENLKIDAATMDYELLYKLPDGRTQGVPGTVKLSGLKVIERELLLGSESSGKFRYDDGVKNGTLTLRFRNDRGKLLAKFSTDFSLLNATATLASVDSEFVYELNKSSSAYFVVMETFGMPLEAPGEIVSGPWGVFSSSSSELPGTVLLDGKLYGYSGSSWDELSDGSSSDIGIFFASGL